MTNPKKKIALWLLTLVVLLLFIRITLGKGKTIQPVAIPSPTPATSTCVTTGCSGQLCVENSLAPIVTTCEYKREYGCYKKTKCEIQNNGKCGWTQNPEFESCIKGE